MKGIASGTAQRVYRHLNPGFLSRMVAILFPRRLLRKLPMSMRIRGRLLTLEMPVEEAFLSGFIFLRELEPLTTGLFRSIAENRSDALFINVGVGEGYYPLLVAKLFTRSATIGFEPNAEMRSRAGRNAELNGEVLLDLRDSLLDSVPTRRSFIEDVTFSRMILPNELHEKALSNEVITMMESSTLDLECPLLELRKVEAEEQLREPVRILLIDVEGSEIEVLKGAERLLKANYLDLIVVEVWPKFRERMVDFASQGDYLLCEITSNSRLRLLGKEDQYLTDNYVLLRTSAADEFEFIFDH